MKPAPHISVLMTVYNTPFGMVVRAIRSVLRQEWQDFELLVLDDGSQAELSRRIEKYCAHYPQQIRYVRHENCGQAQTINRGMWLTESPFVTIIDSDDEYKPQHLAACLAQMHTFDLIASHSHTVVDTDDDYYIPDQYDPTKNVHVDDCILFATLFGKREVFESVPFAAQYGSDADFFSRAATQFRVSKINLRTYVYYRNISNSICSTLKREQQMVAS